MPWINVDGHPVHYTPAPNSTATEEDVRAEIRAILAIDYEAIKAQRAEAMPTDRAALEALQIVYQRLKDMGWNDAIYCPKDGSSFDVIEPGSTGIHRAHYQGTWPSGSWWIEADGDLWPSRPILWRLSPPPPQSSEGVGGEAP